MSKQPRKPRIVRLDEKKPVVQSVADKASQENSTRKPTAQNDLSLVTEQTDDDQAFDNPEIPPSQPVSSGFSWGKLLLGALAGLLSLGIGLAIDQLIRELFERQTWLGWTASALAFLLVLAAFALVLREIWGISRLNTIAAIRKRAANIQSGESSADGIRIAEELRSLYGVRPDLANSRARFERDRINILDGEDLLNLFETQYMKPLDERAKTLVMQSAQRVSVVTAISPRAIVDIAYVLMENTRLIGRISHLYGGRPGMLGFWKLTRNVLGHLAVTGVIAAGDSLIQQIVGHGVAARLSTKLGEGVVNGLLTARIGIAAIEQARPLNFKVSTRPSISEFFTQLSSSFGKSNRQ
jgi:putative membrane protein